MNSSVRSQRMATSLAYNLLAGLLAVAASQATFAQQEQVPGEDESSPVQQFGGPSSVPGQLAEDRRLSDSLTDVDMPESWADWKKRLLE